MTWEKGKCRRYARQEDESRKADFSKGLMGRPVIAQGSALGKLTLPDNPGV
ncbi:hypothetical protein [Cecembia calidifontis]|uniref:hypothetical protein n=1 Tax=Cecembia calidifontis TaxID=1187080 RepID=UPI0013EE6C90|nr:hypothetical protein [Cecembia calidifontis]